MRGRVKNGGERREEASPVSDSGRGEIEVEMDQERDRG